MTRIAPWLLISCAAPLLLAGAPVTKRTWSRDPREKSVKEITLDNGLKVLLLENHTSPVVSVWSWYRAGSANEPAGQTGVAHFAEHLSFEGNESVTREAMTAAVEDAGGAWNGYTWLDESAFVESAPAAKLDALLANEAARMGGATFPEARVEPVRNDVLAELAATSGTAAEALDQEVAAASFHQHPYRAPAAGFQADVARVAREDLLAFYKEWYAPSNATLVVVGDFKSSDATARIRALFASLPQGTPGGAPDVVEPPQDGERRVSLSRDVPSRLLEIAWRAPAVSDPDFPAFLVADAVLAGAKGTNLWEQSDVAAPRGSRLYRSLVAAGLASEARSALAPTRSSYLEAVRVTAADGPEAAKVEAAAIGAAEGIAAEVLADDVARAKARLAAKLVFEAASNTDVGHQLGMFQSLDPSGEGWHRAWHLPELVQKVTLDDVKRVAAKWLVANNRTVGWMTRPAGTPSAAPTPATGPKKTKSATPTWRPKDARVAANEAAPGATASPAASPTSAGGTKARTPKRPPFGPEAMRQVLPNGVVVLAVRNPLAPEVAVRVEVAAGAIRDNAERPGTAALCARLLPSGGGAHGEREVADAFEAAGATLDSFSDLERAGVRSRMLAKDLDKLLPFLREMTVSPSFPRDSFEREKAVAVAEARVREADADAQAEAAMRATIYPKDDPRARPVAGSSASLDAITRVDLAEFHRRFYRPDAAVVVVSGDIDPATAIRGVKKVFGNWKVLAPTPPKIALSTVPDVAPGTGLTRIPSAGSELVAGWPGLSRADEDWPAAALVVAALGGPAGGRLSRALRGDKILASWSEADLDAGVHAGPCLVRAGVSPQNADAALAAIRDTLASLAKDGPTADEVERARAWLVGRLARSLETNASIAASFADGERMGDGAEGPRATAARLHAATSDDVARVAKSWVSSTAPAVLAAPKQ